MSVQQQLQAAGVQYVRILWCNNANVIRGKAAHISLLADGLPDGGSALPWPSKPCVKQAKWSALKEVALEEEVQMLAERY